MYAVIKTGGKQYKVSPGDTLKVESLEGDKGAVVELTEVLLVENEGAVTVGMPVVAGAKVKAEVIRQGRGKKVLVFKHKKRKNFRKMNGHRQNFTEIKIQDISA